MDNNNMNCSSTELMHILGISKRTLTRYREAQVIVSNKKDEYDIALNVQNYVDFKCKGADLGTEIDYNREKALLTKAQRKLAELELAKQQGYLLSKDDIIQHCGRIANNIKTRFLAIPTKAASLIAKHDDPVAIKAILDKYVREVLDEVAKYNPVQEKED